MPPPATLAQLIPSLDLEREDQVPTLGWLEDSYRDPGSFLSLLIAHARFAYPPAPRSRPGVAIDLYADAITRNLDSDRIALRIYDRLKSWQNYSYSDLDARALALAWSWSDAGIAPGDSIGILLPFGLDYITTYLAALRLGAVPSFLQPHYEAYLAPRLDKLAPKGLVFDPRRPPPISKKMQKLLLPPGAPGARPSLPSYAYLPDDPCATLFSSVHGPLNKPTPLMAEIAFFSALRDAVLAYRLKPGDGLCAPAFHREQHLPAILLATLLAGATYLHLPIEELTQNPALLTEQPIHVLGVGETLGELLRNNPLAPLPSLRHLFRPVDEPLDWLKANDFVTQNKLKKIPSSNLLIDSAAGGCVLFSTRRPGSISARVLPSAGQPFMLLDASTGKEAVAGHGVYVPLRDKKPLYDGWFVLARVGEEYLFGGSYLPRRAARIFPSTELSAFVSEMPFVEGACVAPVATGEPGGRFRFVLLVYTGAAKEGASPKERAKTQASIEKSIAKDLGPDFLPDRLVIAPLYPRFIKKKLDVDWARNQYLSGQLAFKTEEPAFQHLTALRGRLLDSS